MTSLTGSLKTGIGERETGTGPELVMTGGGEFSAITGEGRATAISWTTGLAMAIGFAAGAAERTTGRAMPGMIPSYAAAGTPALYSARTASACFRSAAAAPVAPSLSNAAARLSIAMGSRDSMPLR